MMNPKHPAWPEFLELVSDGLEPDVRDGEVMGWKYSGDLTFAVAACRELGLSGDEILDSVEWWNERGAFNDDAIMLNLA